MTANALGEGKPRSMGAGRTDGNGRPLEDARPARGPVCPLHGAEAINCELRVGTGQEAGMMGAARQAPMGQSKDRGSDTDSSRGYDSVGGTGIQCHIQKPGVNGTSDEEGTACNLVSSPY